jgi:hypothetical protein
MEGLDALDEEDLKESELKQGDLVLRVDRSGPVVLTEFKKFKPKSANFIIGADFKIVMKYKLAGSLGRVPTISVFDNEPNYELSLGQESKYYYGSRSTIAQALVQEGFEPHARVLFPEGFK